MTSQLVRGWQNNINEYWEDLRRYGKTWEDLGRFTNKLGICKYLLMNIGKTWEDMVSLGSFKIIFTDYQN